MGGLSCALVGEAALPLGRGTHLAPEIAGQTPRAHPQQAEQPIPTVVQGEAVLRTCLASLQAMAMGPEDFLLLFAVTMVISYHG